MEERDWGEKETDLTTHRKPVVRREEERGDLIIVIQVGKREKERDRWERESGIGSKGRKWGEKRGGWGRVMEEERDWGKKRGRGVGCCRMEPSMVVLSSA